MIVIVDCGSSKTNWCFLDSDGTAITSVTGGMNALLLTSEEMSRRIAEELVPVVTERQLRPDAIYFYGAGCVSEQVCASVKEALLAHFECGYVEVASDLLAAARALCGTTPGIACILGTGSNSCLYDGDTIVDNVSPLGFILGDEGSGAVIGRQFVGDVLKKQLPPEVCDDFYGTFGLGRLDIIAKVYKQPQPNRFLASFMPFIHAHLSCPQVRRLVKDSFMSFFRRNVLAYPGHDVLRVNFVGSVAYFFSDILEEAAGESGCTPGIVIREPMERLVEYHLSRQNV